MLNNRIALIFKKIFELMLPGGIVLIAALVGYRFVDKDSCMWLPLVDSYGAYVILGIGFLLGWRFHRSRLAFIILILMLADRVLYYFGPGGVSVYEHDRIVFYMVSILLPVNISLFYFVKERGIFNLQGLIRFLFIFAQPLTVYIILREKPGLFKYLQQPFGRMPLFDWLSMPPLVFYVYAGTILVFLGGALYYQQPIIRGFFWAMIAIASGIDVAVNGAGTTVFFTLAGLIIILAVIETAYAMAYNDELTGLPARRSLNTTLQGLGRKYTIAMLDIDFFKKFNDKYGHDVGDQVLCMVASHIRRVGGGGKSFRYGGEEFTVVFPGKSKKDALPYLEELRKSIAEAKFAFRGKDRPKKTPKKRVRKNNPKTVSVTISIGAAEPRRNNSKPAQVIKSADQALYRAKKKGRNCVVG